MTIEKSTTPKKRLDYIDILRGIGIMIMLMGHIGYGGKFDRYIHTFHMPLFFFVSGYFYTYRPNNLINKVVKKFRTLIIPYIIFGVINYVFWLFLEFSEGAWFVPLIRLVSYNTHGLPIAGALWFLTALYFAEIFYELIVKVCRKDYVVDLVVLILSVGCSIFTTVCDFRPPFALDVSIVGMGIYHIGRRFRGWSENNEEIVKKCSNNIFFIGILFFVNLVLAFVNGYVNMKSGWYSNVILSWINMCIGIAPYFLLSLYLMDIKILKPITNLLKYIGKNSIVFVGLNQLVIFIFKIFMPNVMGTFGAFSVEGVFWSSVVLAATTMSLMLIAYFYEKLQKGKI